MTINETCVYARKRLNDNGLHDWSVRINSNITNVNAIGMCLHNDKTIIINTFSIELHPTEEVKNTINHEVAHALVGPGHGHDEVWASRARLLGCTNTRACSHLALPEHLIDALRSGSDVEYTVEEEKIYTPKYTVKKIQDICPRCGKVAVEKKSWIEEDERPGQPDMKIIRLECGHSITKLIPKGTPFHTLVTPDGKKPYPFQIEGMKFGEAALAQHRGVLIADEMGLGKTPQSIGIAKFGGYKKILVVTKSSVKYQWWREFFFWAGDEYTAQIIQTSRDYLLPLRVYISSYDIFTPKVRKSKRPNTAPKASGFPIEKLKDIDLMILDECQQIKNPDSIRTNMIRKIAKLSNCAVIGLSGTPWKNRGSELFTILNLLDPMKFNSYAGFIRDWVDTYFNGRYEKQAGIKRIKQFKEYTKDIIIRREISEVLPDLPQTNRTMLYCELENYEQKAYDDATSDFVQWYNQLLEGGDEINSFTEGTNILAKLARMRHIVGVAKIPATLDYLEQFLEETERKIVIFHHHLDVAEILMDECRAKYPDIPLFQIKSSMKPEERDATAEQFNKTERAILIAGILTLGEGVNLQSCADCIMHEREWNPANEDQAAPGRFRRIGQTKQTNIHFVLARDTVDDILTNIVEPKRAWFHNAHNKGEMPVWNMGDIAKEMAEGIVRQFETGKRMKELASK